MNFVKRIRNIVPAFCLFIVGTTTVHAESNQDKLSDMQQQIQQNDKVIQQKEQEKDNVQKEMQAVQQELEEINNSIAKNQEALAQIEEKITDIKRLIEQKKQEIVMLEDKVATRKDVMKERIVSIQHNDNTNIYIDILVNSENLAELLERMSAVSAILDADKDILKLQQEDLERIERDKQVIDEQEKELETEQEKLAQQQAEMAANMQKKQEALQAIEAKYNELSSQITLAEQEKQKIESGMKEIQAAIAREQEAAKAAQVAKASQTAQAAPVEAAPNDGREMYVVATAYSAEGSPENEGITAAGYNIKENPNMKLIAVDPKVIPLGKRVWVEGYGTAIAGDTGGKIKNHKIDVLMPSHAAALQWGVKIVKIKVLD
ncbi:MAG: 3D domain-containing protein [Ectobacillus sp.]